jgi:hypothetical protein
MVDRTWAANLDRDARLERILRVNISCAHEASLWIADVCGGRRREHRVRGGGFLQGFQVSEANARADGKELVVGFQPQKPTERYRGSVVVAHLERPRAGACPRLVYLFAHDLEAPPPARSLTNLLVELTQLEPASASKELRIVEVYGAQGRRETRARHDGRTGRYAVYETTVT